MAERDACMIEHAKVEYIVAHGVSSFIGNKKAVIGSYHFVMEDEKCVIPKGEENNLDTIDEKYSRIFLAIDGVLSAVLCVFDPVRVEAKKTIDSLRRLGFKNICMMTGDNKKTAASVAERLGIDHYQAEVLPEDKALYVKHMRDMGLTGVITPSASALMHNGSTIMIGLKSTTRLIETKDN